MKTSKKMLSVLCAAIAMATAFVGCSEIDMFSVNAPEDLQSRIDEIAAANNVDHGDTTYVTINNLLVGAEDNSNGWNSAVSEWFTIPANKLLHLEFVNYGSEASNWNNWNYRLASTDETEIFLIRSDAYGWGNSDYNSVFLKNDYPDLDEDGDIWNDFRGMMDGAYTTIELDHSVSGYAFLTAKMECSNGVTLTETYNQPVSATADVIAQLVCDNSHFVMKKAYLIPSKVQAIEDQLPVSITVTGTPASLELGDENFWGNGVATVTFADGATAVADTADVTFMVPDLTTVGVKTVFLSYSKTKQGEYCKPINGKYTIEVTNPIVGLEASAKAFVIGGAKYLTTSKGNVQVTAIYGDGSKAILANSLYEVAFTDDKTVYDAVPGTIEDAYTVTYTSANGETITTTGDLVIAASSLEGQTTQVGADDFSTGWWVVPDGFSKDWKVEAGESQTVGMYVGSDNAGNWHSPCTVLRGVELNEYAVVRMDHYGWGDGYGVAAATSNWNWDTFMSSINGSKVYITVSNNGDDTADVLYYVIYPDGELHFQHYEGITVNSADLYFANVTEESYLIYE